LDTHKTPSDPHPRFSVASCKSSIPYVYTLDTFHPPSPVRASPLPRRQPSSHPGSAPPRRDGTGNPTVRRRVRVHRLRTLRINQSSHRAAFRSVSLKAQRAKKSGWRLAALRVRIPRVDAGRTKPTGGCDERNETASRRDVSLKPPPTSSSSGIIHSFRSTTHLLRANTPSRTHRTKPSSIAFGASIATHTARKIRFRSPCPSVSISRSNRIDPGRRGTK